VNPLFEGFAQQDAHEALRTILNDMHERLTIQYPIGLFNPSRVTGSSLKSPTLRVGSSDSEELPTANGYSAAASDSSKFAKHPPSNHGAKAVGAADDAKIQEDGEGRKRGNSGRSIGSQGSRRSGVVKRRIAPTSQTAEASSMELDSDESDTDKQPISAAGQATAARSNKRRTPGGDEPPAEIEDIPPSRQWLVDGPYTGPDTVSRSIISDLFQGVYSSTVRCRSCQAVSVTYDFFYDLSLSVPKKQHPVARGSDGTRTSKHGREWVKKNSITSPDSISTSDAGAFPTAVVQAAHESEASDDDGTVTTNPGVLSKLWCSIRSIMPGSEYVSGLGLGDCLYSFFDW
jgi:hypothetical protein